MKLRSGTGRLWIAVTAVVGLAGCKDSGLPDRNLPIDQARHREFGYPAYQPTADNPPVAHAGRHWIRSLPLESIPAGLLEPVGGADGLQLYALRGSRPPYTRLYTPIGEDRWAPLLRLN
ncbi:MAG TPA: hypothetical protein VK936_05655 [Longimicrobiales bacterium]|nr:hypothetical protein [Longimicrobiales bacterium]